MGNYREGGPVAVPLTGWALCAWLVIVTTTRSRLRHEPSMAMTIRVDRTCGCDDYPVTMYGVRAHETVNVTTRLATSSFN